MNSTLTTSQTTPCSAPPCKPEACATTAELLQGRRRPVWRHHYDPYAGPPVAQTVEEALARAAKAPPGTIPEVEMLTDEEIDQRMEEIRNSPPRPSSRSQARRKR